MNDVAEIVYGTSGNEDILVSNHTFKRTRVLYHNFPIVPFIDSTKYKYMLVQ